MVEILSSKKIGLKVAFLECTFLTWFRTYRSVLFQ